MILIIYKIGLKLHIYIHVPFCDSKCGYCGFFSQTDKGHLIADYFSALRADLGYQLESFGDLDSKINTIFIGGGTPNAVDSIYYEDIFSLLSPFYSDNCEISIESNPNLITKNWLSDMKNLGINRISLGVQSFFSDKLELLERHHNATDTLNAIDLVRQYFDNISIDLIYNTALDSKKRLSEEIKTASALNLSHISAYSLSIDNNSHFAKFNRHDTRNSDNLSDFIRDLLRENNFMHYEVSNYCKLDSNLLKNTCKHNLAYWAMDEYLGVGASSVGRVKNRRYTGAKNIESYIKNPTQKSIEILNENDLIFEEIFLGLRSILGVKSKVVREFCAKNKTTEKLKNLLKENVCYEKNGRIYASDLFMADNIVLYI